MEENASNALLIAGGVLIAIMIISLGVYIFQTSANFARNYEVEREQIELTSFNSQFEKYAKEEATFHEIVTVANLAKEINTANGIDMKKTRDEKYKGIAIQIQLEDPNTGLASIKMEQKSDKEIMNLLNEVNQQGNGYVMNNGTLCKYKASITYNDNTRKVSLMTFYKIN